MNKFSKICLIIAAITCSIGLGTLISSIAMGASVNDLEDAIVRGDYAFVGGNKLSLSHTSRRDYTDWDDDEYYGDYTNATDKGTYNDITKLDVEMTGGGFYIEESDTDDIRVEVSGPNSKKTTITQKGNELKIHNDYRPPYDGSVTLYCPADTKFDEVDIHVGGGEAVVNVPLEAKEMDVEIGAGRFESNELITAKESDWSVGAGEIVVGLLTSKKSDFECGAGVIDASFTDSRTDYDYELECSVGQIVLDDEEYSGVGTERKENNHADQKIKAEVSMGTITLSFDN